MSHQSWDSSPPPAVHYAKDIPDISVLAEQSPYVKIRIGGQKIKTSVCKGELRRRHARNSRIDSCPAAAERRKPRRGAACADGKTKPVWGEVLHYTVVNETDMHVAVSGPTSGGSPPAQLVCSAAPTLPGWHCRRESERAAMPVLLATQLVARPCTQPSAAA